MSSFADSGEVGEAGDRRQRQALYSKEAGFRFVAEAKHIRQACDHAAHAEVYGAVSFKADSLRRSAGIVSAQSGDCFRAADWEAFIAAGIRQLFYLDSA